MFQKKLANTNRLIDRLDNIKKDCSDFKESLENDLAELGVEVNNIFSYKIDDQPLIVIDLLKTC